MARIYLIALFVVVQSYGNKNSPRLLAREVCDCFVKNQNISFPDPETGIADDECSRMQVKAIERFNNDSRKKKQFDRSLRECAGPMIDELFKRGIH